MSWYVLFKLKIVFFVLFLISISYGCVGFQDYDFSVSTNEVNTVNIEGEKTLNFEIDKITGSLMSTREKLSVRNRDEKIAITDFLKKGITETLYEMNFFQDIKFNSNELSDMKAIFSFEIYRAPRSLSNKLWGFSLFILPASLNFDEYTITTTFVNGDGEILKEYKKSVSCECYGGLVMFPLMFIYGPDCTYNKKQIIKDMVRSTFFDAKKDGLF